jgi:superoxide reductase
MPLQRSEMYKCGDADCPAVVEVQIACDCDRECNLTCCDQPMQLLEEKTADAATEKHVPVIEKVDGGYKVKVGSVPHPMEADHYIVWIELHLGDMVQRTYLNPGDAPEATFQVGSCCGKCGEPAAREYCNKHALWKG